MREIRKWIGKEKGYNGPMGHLFRFSTSFPRIVAIGNFLGPWYDEEESVDRIRIGASAVTWENRKRELSLAGRSARVTTPFSFTHPVARCIYLSPKPLFASFLSTTVSLALSLPAINAKISAKRKRMKERKRERRGYYSSKLSLYISVRLTLNHNEHRRLKTRSRIIGALMRF